MVFKNGQLPWNKGRKLPEFSGENHPMFGRKHTLEAKRAMSEKHKGMKQSEITIAKRMTNMPKHALFQVGHAPFKYVITEEHRERISGEKSSSWKGDNIGYQGVHAWLRRTYGNADACESPSCEQKSKDFNWAKITGRNYERKRENYWKLCSPCYHVYDRTGDKAWITRRKKTEYALHI